MLHLLHVVIEIVLMSEESQMGATKKVVSAFFDMAAVAALVGLVLWETVKAPKISALLNLIYRAALGVPLPYIRSTFFMQLNEHILQEYLTVAVPFYKWAF